MEGGEDVLIDGFDGDGVDVVVSKRFEEGFGVGSVGLVALDVGTDGVGREKNDGVTEALEFSCPVVSGTAGFEEDSCRLTVCKETFEAGSGEAVIFPDRAGLGRDSELEDGFREIDSDGGRVHGGLLLITGK